MFGVFTSIKIFPIIQTASECTTIQLSPDTNYSELAQIPQVKDSVLQHSPNFRCRLQVLGYQLHLWAASYKSGIPMLLSSVSRIL